MRIFICVGVILSLTCVLEHCHCLPMQIEDRLSLMDELHYLSEITNDIARGDYVASAMDGIRMLQGLDLHWSINVVLDIFLFLLKIIHPVFIRVFTVAKDRGSLLANLQGGIDNGIDSLLSIASLFG